MYWLRKAYIARCGGVSYLGITWMWNWEFVEFNKSQKDKTEYKIKDWIEREYKTLLWYFQGPKKLQEVIKCW